MKDLYAQWKQTHNKVYPNALEDEFRFNIFRQNYLDILEFNAESDSAKLGLNKFADLTREEFGALHTGYYPSNGKGEVKVFDTTNIPASVDWRTKGAVTPVKKPR